MSEFRRRLMMAQKRENILPEGYTRLQYVYNTSNAYINTGVLIDSNDIIDTQWEALPDFRKSYDAMVCGAKSILSHNLYYGNTDLYLSWGNSSGFRLASPDQRVRVERGKFYSYKGGAVLNTADKTSYSFAATNPLYLFSMNNGNTPKYPLKEVGIKYFNIKSKWNGIPCIDPDGVVGMYDTVNQRFHSSPNGTAFIAGPVY